MMTSVSESVVVSAVANAWVEDSIEQSAEVILPEEGICRLCASQPLVIFACLPQKGILAISLEIRVFEGKPASVQVTVEDTVRAVDISNPSFKRIPCGEFLIRIPGYARIRIRAQFRGRHEPKGIMADIRNVILSGPACSSKNSHYNKVHFIRDDIYFGRRGPSVHLQYEIPSEDPIEWFYSGVRIPHGHDVVGMFAMAAGFQQGYFGIQVNSLMERRVLFSVWSPQQTDDPAEVFEENMVTTIRGGPDVVIQPFGGEGAGRQCFKRVFWRTGQTYCFLLQAKPSSEADWTIFTSYFLDPVAQKWNLIASLKRPKVKTSLAGLHCFLENFNPSSGHLVRSATFKNAFVRTSRGHWIEVTRARFTYDATAAAHARWDYHADKQEDGFCLQHCGFFDANISYGTVLVRTPTDKTPDLDLKHFKELQPEIPCGELQDYLTNKI